MKKILFLCAVVCTILFTACTSSSAAPTTSNAATTVHMNETQFVPASITIQKGGKLTLVDDVAITHIIQNGEWDSNGLQRPRIEAGAPTVQAQLNGNDQQSVGPFNTAGTFHLYCTIHDNMNLVVTVK